jgi:hypothetical protein
MNSKNELERVKESARIISIILKVIFITTIVGIVGGIIGMAITNLIPKETLNSILSPGVITNSVSLGNLSFDLENATMGVNDIIKMFNISLLMSTVLLFLFGMVVKQLIKIMKVIQEGTPFTQQCSKSIGIIGIVIMVCSVVLPSAMEFIIFKIFNVQNALIASNQISQVKYTVHCFDGSILIFGIIVFMLGGIFKYGCYLQDEYDSTL